MKTEFCILSIRKDDKEQQETDKILKKKSNKKINAGGMYNQNIKLQTNFNDFRTNSNKFPTNVQGFPTN